MCFIQDGVTYKAWRGFDPGPNTSLKVNCFISNEKLSAQEIDRYLCKTENIIHSGSSYSEFAQHCWSKETCRRFVTESDYNLFLKRGAENVALYKIVPSKEMREITVNYEYVDEQQAEKLRASWMAEEERYCLEANERHRKSCLEELSELKAFLVDDDDWRYRLTEKALMDSFSELKSQNVVFQDTSHLDYAAKFKFTPHKAKDSSTYFYSVECPAEHRKTKTAICTISLNQAFYSELSSEYFYIDKTSDVKTALWAYSAHKGVEVTPANDWMARWLKHLHRAPSVEIDGEVAKFSYHSGGCWHQVWYRIVGSNDRLEFLKTSGGFCV